MTKMISDIFIDIKKELSSEFEAREIIAFALDLDRHKMNEWITTYIGEDSIKKIYEVFKRRQNNEPIAYIIGEWEFYSLPLKITNDVLIPRQDTETLVDEALNILKKQEKARVLDICCGSGCIGIALAHYTKNTKVVACDISKKAIEIAHYNAKINGVKDRYMAIECDVFNNTKKLGKFDMIVSNPPYIPKKDIECLEKNVRDFEPIIALDGGECGLIFYEQICKEFLKLLNEGGTIIFEYGIGQEEDIKKILEKNGLINIEIKPDLCGINRIIKAMKPNTQGEL